MIIIAIIVAFAMGIVGWVYVSLKPPTPKICGTPNGPPVTSPRVKLNDGRHLAYKEFGVPKEKAKYKIIISHGYNASKHMHLSVSQVSHSYSFFSYTYQCIFFLTILKVYSFGNLVA